MLLDLETPNFETVNATFAAFVEFLYRLGGLIATDPGGRARAARAAALREELMGIDRQRSPTEVLVEHGLR